MIENGRSMHDFVTRYKDYRDQSLRERLAAEGKPSRGVYDSQGGHAVTAAKMAALQIAQHPEAWPELGNCPPDKPEAILAAIPVQGFLHRVSLDQFTALIRAQIAPEARLLGMSVDDESRARRRANVYSNDGRGWLTWGVANGWPLDEPLACAIDTSRDLVIPETIVVLDFTSHPRKPKGSPYGPGGLARAAEYRWRMDQMPRLVQEEMNRWRLMVSSNAGDNAVAAAFGELAAAVEAARRKSALDSLLAVAEARKLGGGLEKLSPSTILLHDAAFSSYYGFLRLEKGLTPEELTLEQFHCYNNDLPTLCEYVVWYTFRQRGFHSGQLGEYWPTTLLTYLMRIGSYVRHFHYAYVEPYRNASGEVIEVPTSMVAAHVLYGVLHGMVTPLKTKKGRTEGLPTLLEWRAGAMRLLEKARFGRSRAGVSRLTRATMGRLGTMLIQQSYVPLRVENISMARFATTDDPEDIQRRANFLRVGPGNPIGYWELRFTAEQMKTRDPFAVTLPDELTPVLDEWVASGGWRDYLLSHPPINPATAQRDPEGSLIHDIYLMYPATGGQVWSEDSIRRDVKRWSPSIFDKELTPHLIRHIVATFMMSDRRNAELAAALLHNKPATMRRFYDLTSPREIAGQGLLVLAEIARSAADRQEGKRNGHSGGTGEGPNGEQGSIAADGSRLALTRSRGSNGSPSLHGDNDNHAAVARNGNGYQAHGKTGGRH
jgi:hypothetical protein